jgi:hypothetical protein
MKILPVGAELFHTDRQTDRHTDMTELIVAFHTVANVPKYWLFQYVYFVIYNELYFCHM